MDRKFFLLEGAYAKAFWGLIIFSFVYIASIVRADVYYIDDIGRTIYAGNWNSNGRPAATLLALLLCDGTPIMDVSPIPQMLAVLTLSYTMLLFVRKYMPNLSAFKAFSAVSFGYMNLFLLENFAYRYEAFMIMALSVFFLLYAMPEKWGTTKKLLLSASLVIFSLSLYQTAIGAYIALMIVEFIYLCYKELPMKEVLRQVGIRVAGLGLGGIIYKLIIAKKYLSTKDGYTEIHSSLVNPLEPDAIQIVCNNFAAFGAMFKVYARTMGVLGIIIAVILVIGLGYLTYNYAKYKQILGMKKLTMMLGALIVFIFIAVASILPMAFLARPIFAPRVMLSFTVFTLLAGMLLCRLSDIRREVSAVLVISCMCILSLSASFGNLLGSQDRMNSLVASYLVYDINDVENINDKKISTISIIGRAPKCKELKMAIQKKPLYDRLVPICMNNDWMWGGKYLEHYRMGKISMKVEKDDEEHIKKLTPVKSNEFYNLYLCNDKLVVLFLAGND